MIIGCSPSPHKPPHPPGTLLIPPPPTCAGFVLVPLCLIPYCLTSRLVFYSFFLDVHHHHHHYYHPPPPPPPPPPPRRVVLVALEMASSSNSVPSLLIPSLSGLDLSQHNSVVGTIIRVNAGFSAAITIIIALRLYVRLRIVHRVGSDDSTCA
jgi:hypothetical protein